MSTAMTSSENTAGKIIVDSDVVEGWRLEVRSIDKSIHDLEAKRASFEQRIVAAEALFNLISGQHEAVSAAGVSPRRYGRATVIEMVASIVQGAGMISMPEIRRRLEESEVGHRLAESDKGFYHALSRLSERKIIIRHNGWCFTPSAYEAHRKAVDGGAPDVEDISVSRRSPMADEIAAFVQRKGKAKSAEIIAHLKRHPDFADTLSANTTGAYNVMSRMVKRRELGKDGTTYMAVPSQPANEPSASGELFNGERS